MVILIRVSLEKLGIDPDEVDWDGFFEFVGTGFYLSVIGAIILLFSSARRNAS